MDEWSIAPLAAESGARAFHDAVEFYGTQISAAFGIPEEFLEMNRVTGDRTAYAVLKLAKEVRPDENK